METGSLTVASPEAMEALGAAFARQIPGPLIIYLYGNLGAGKTTFVRGLIHSFHPEAKVKSPTFTLVEPYEDLPRPVYHFDLYRLLDPEELELIGARDYLGADSWCLVEWPEKGGTVLPEADLEIHIDYHAASRSVRLIGNTPRGTEVIQRLLAAGVIPNKT